jgi:hypothetical protein
MQRTDSGCHNTIEDLNKKNVPARLPAVGHFHNFIGGKWLVLGNDSLFWLKSSSVPPNAGQSMD